MNASTSQRSQRRRSVSLFEQMPGASAEDVARQRVADFARVVARRHRAGRGDGSDRGHRSERGDLAKMLVALRGYYRSWSLCAPFRLPALDEELIGIATAAYSEAARLQERRAAA